MKRRTLVGNAVGNNIFKAKEKGLGFRLSPCIMLGSGGWIRTIDLRVMSPTSCQTAPPRSNLIILNVAPHAVKDYLEAVSIVA